MPVIVASHSCSAESATVASLAVSIQMVMLAGMLRTSRRRDDIGAGTLCDRDVSLIWRRKNNTSEYSRARAYRALPDPSTDARIQESIV
jgi:hypothetical protein